MATVIKKPSKIHTAFNPVILQLRAVSQTERDNGIQCMLTSDDRTSSLFREFFNDLTRFDLSEVLKYWFTEETVNLEQSSYCFLDKKLAFEYNIDLSASTSIAVNAVVQLQRNPDMTTWGNRFLTSLPVLKKYKGYPLDISYLNNSQNAFVSFNGNTENRDEAITNLHFSINIPDNITSVIISNISLTVNLLTNSGIPILTNNSRNIVVKNTIKASIQVVEELLPACIPGSPFYVRWINQLGGFDYWMFYMNQIYEQSVKTLATINPVIDDILNANYIEREVDKDVSKTVSVGAGNLTDTEHNELLKISTSPLVEVWDVEVQKWYRVYVASGKFESSTRDMRKEIEIELTLPVPQIQF